MDQKLAEEDVAALLRRVVEVLKNAQTFSPSDDDLVVQYRDPQDLEDLLDLKLGDATSVDGLIDLISKTAKLSVHTCHPLFFNQLYGGLDPYGLVGTVVSETLNTSAYTYEVAPVFSLSEREVIRASLDLFGFKNGDGIFSPGGSISNMYGIVLSRFHRFPDVKKTGVFGLPPLVIYTSEDSHYSVTKGAHWLGLGIDNVVKVKSDLRGKMLPSELGKAIQNSLSNGKTPLVVNCTGGSTVLGAFDPLDEIAEICKSYGIWMHVDGCWGGSLLLSKKHHHKLAGIEKADSVSWNPHKMLGAPLQCSMFLVKHKGLLQSCNMAGASYLFQPDKMYDPAYDSGDKSVQCGRKVDSFKLWAMWKVRGTFALGNLVDHAIEVANYFLEKIRGRPGFKLVLDEFETTNICFWFIPRRLRNLKETKEWWDEIHKVGPAVKKMLVKSGEMMIGYQPLEHRNLKNFFRLVVTCHPLRSEKHMDLAIELIEKYGNDL